MLCPSWSVCLRILHATCHLCDDEEKRNQSVSERESVDCSSVEETKRCKKPYLELLLQR